MGQSRHLHLARELLPRSVLRMDQVPCGIRPDRTTPLQPEIRVLRQRQLHRPWLKASFQSRSFPRFLVGVPPPDSSWLQTPNEARVRASCPFFPYLSQKKQETIRQINVREAHTVRMRLYRFQSDSIVVLNDFNSSIESASKLAPSKSSFKGMLP